MSGAMRILIVEDDRGMRQSLSDLLEAADWHVTALSRADQVAGKLDQAAPDVILSDVRMPGMSGLDLLDALAADAPPLVLISAHGDIPMAVDAMSRGAYSFVEKPYEPRRLLTILRHAADQRRMQATNTRLKERLARLSGLDRILLGQTAEVRRLRDDILDLADITAPVLLTGETGTGKELVARALHDLGPRSGGPFLALNCATLTDASFAANMFGDVSERTGAIAAADGGTLFLDEVAACPAAVQPQLLRVLEQAEIMPSGAATPRRLDLRVIAATNEDVTAAVADGRLREDLLFRLNTTALNLPPLRERRDDIPLLATHFLAALSQTYEISPPALGTDDIAALLAHDWPGNVRELRNAAERRVLAARRGNGSMAQAIGTGPEPDDVPETLRAAVATFEREMIGKAITAHQGRMDAVAEALGIGRRTLNEKIVKLGLDKDQLL